MAQQSFTIPISPNPYISHTINNINLINTLNKKRQDWTKKHYKIIQEIKTMANIQLQIQNIAKLAIITNIQLEEIEITILQASHNYRIQTLLVDKLDSCKEKENKYADKHIKKYKMNINKTI